jgi:hypothetical protein
MTMPIMRAYLVRLLADDFRVMPAHDGADTLLKARRMSPSGRGGRHDTRYERDAFGWIARRETVVDSCFTIPLARRQANSVSNEELRTNKEEVESKEAGCSLKNKKRLESFNAAQERMTRRLTSRAT